ncbi:MAG: hypothetical protein ABH837_01835 [bacterium]
MVKEKSITNPFDFYAVDCFESWGKLQDTLYLSGLSTVIFGLLLSSSYSEGYMQGFWISLAIAAILYIGILFEDGLISFLWLAIPTLIGIILTVVCGFHCASVFFAVFGILSISVAAIMGCIPKNLIKR